MGYINTVQRGSSYWQWVTEFGNNGKEWELHVALYLAVRGWSIEGMRVNAYGSEIDILATSPGLAHGVVECHDSNHSMGFKRIRRLKAISGLKDSEDSHNVIPILARTGEVSSEVRDVLRNSNIRELTPYRLKNGDTPYGWYRGRPELSTPQKITEKDIPVDWNPSEVCWLERDGRDKYGFREYTHQHL